MRFKTVKNNEKLWLSFIEKLLTIYYTNLAISVFDKIIQHTVVLTFEIFPHRKCTSILLIVESRCDL